MIDLRPAYHEHQASTRAQLTRARAGLKRPDGALSYRLGCKDLAITEVIGEVNARYLSDRQIDGLALRDAEYVMNIAEAQHRHELAAARNR